MNKIATFLFLVLAIPSQGLAQAADHSISLQDAINYALTHNQNILNAKLNIEASEAVVKLNITTGMPQINGSVDLSDNFELPTSFLPAEIVGGPAGTHLPVQFGTAYSGNAVVAANQMVFDGVFFVGLEAAKTYKELSTKAHIKTEIDVVEAVTKAYYNVLVNDLILELIEKNLGRLDTLLRDTRAMYEGGFAERIDVSRVQVPYNNMKVTHDNTKKMFAVAESLLKFQMGMPISESLVLTDELTSDMFEHVEDENFSYQQRIEYSMLQTQERLRMLDVKQTKVQYLPKLDLYANMGALAGTNTAGDLFDISNQWYWFGTIGLRMSVPIFDGLRKHMTIQQKKAELNKVYNSFDMLKNSMDLEIEQTKIAYNNSIDYMKVQLENMQISEDVYNVTKIKYEEGVGSNIEVITADADYKQAQTNYFQALYSALVAKVDYEKALGKLNQQ